MTELPDLPITALVPAIKTALDAAPSLVLQAPPGAGKTTIVPLALLDASWRNGGKILMLEPRRLATRAAARRMASLLAEPVGETVGYRVRLERKIGPATRIEVITDGIFTRMIQDDPALEGIAAVLFDEFHERRLETDLGLALALETQETLRPDLRLIAMSATLDAAPVARLMGNAEIITASGRMFAVERRHRAAPAAGRLAEAVVDTILDALDAPGDILVFLPGGAEIRRVDRLLGDRIRAPNIRVWPLYGDLDPAAQDRALSPAPSGERKIVLSTSIAETSLTIEGVTQVIDAGQTRRSRYDPRTGMTRLETVPVSQATAEQRAGRAGRTAPGIAWRLWPEAAHKALAQFPTPEIALTDAADLALELAAWGIDDPAKLRLLDPPPEAAFATARRLLQSLGALDASGRLTGHGRAMAKLGLPPRLGHMVRAAAPENGALAVAIAAVLTEPDEARGVDLRARLERLSGRQTEIAKRLARQAGLAWRGIEPSHAGSVLALAYPDRIAQRRGGGKFRLASGQGAWLAETDPLAASDWLAVADLDGQMPDSRIWLAAPLAEAELISLYGDRIKTEDAVWYAPDTSSVQAKRRRKLGALVLSDTVLSAPDPAAVSHALLDWIRREGLSVLAWSPAARQLQARVACLARLDGHWPALDDASLLASLDQWLAPAIAGKRSLADLHRIDLAATLGQLLDWEQQRRLDRLAPTHLVVPSGSRIPIDYHAGDQPVLAVKLQELFGLTQHPTIAEGRIRLVLHLLSPAQRPIQVTSDLAGFWAGSYKAVRADLRGRYPKHPWPEDPLTAPPTARAKPRGQ
jgi:ATP-dependent helicase HrpB